MSDLRILLARLDDIDNVLLRLDASMIDLQAQLETLLPRSRRGAALPTEYKQEVLNAALSRYFTTVQPISYNAFVEGFPLRGSPNGAEYGIYLQLSHLCAWITERYPQLNIRAQRVRSYLLMHNWHQKRLAMRDMQGVLHKKRYWFLRVEQ